MRLKMKARQEVTAVTAGQYRGASKKEKRLLLDQFVTTTGYSRWYARFVLRHEGQRIHLDKQTVVLAVRRGTGRRKRKRLSRSEIGGRSESSVEVRAGVHADKSDLKNLMVAGEVMENATGKSSLYLQGLVDPPDPTSDGRGRVTNTLGPVGIAFGQTLRVTFLNVGSNPLEAEPCWFDSDGAHLKTGPTFTLAPGQMRSFEISWSEAAGGRTETRVQMRGAAHVDRNGAKHLVMAGEVVEDASGRSSLYVSPGTRKGFDPQPDPPAAR